MFSGGTSETYLFVCDSCGYEYLMSPQNTKTQGCPYPHCNSKPTQLCYNPDCEKCFFASFASHDNSFYFSDKNKYASGNIIDPRYLFKYSQKQYWFKCDENHEFYASLNNVARGSWCPYPCCCKSGKSLCNNDKCTFCFKASFASSPKVKYFSPDNNVSPRDLRKSSHNVYKFKCDKGCEFEMRLDHITNGSWCRGCKNPNEEHCRTVLEELTGKKFKNVRPLFLKGLELDGYNEDSKLAFEYNGQQHYKFVSLFHFDEDDLIAQQKRDIDKIRRCKRNKVHLIIIPYWIENKKKFIEDEYKKYLLITK
jgi:hypothetical protein